jgi:hypothetical protein
VPVIAKPDGPSGKPITAFGAGAIFQSSFRRRVSRLFSFNSSFHFPLAGSARLSGQRTVRALPELC